MDSIQYTRPVIKGEPYQTMLPKGTALVCEGGGTRGYYSAGVFEAFMDAGWMFPYIVGVSAGAANALSYISGQKLRNRALVEHFAGNPRYISYGNMLRGSFIGMDFIFGDVPRKHLFFDDEMFRQAKVTFFTGVTDCETGQSLWFPKGRIDKHFTVVRASCSVPFVTPPIEFEGYRLSDGGVSSPIPIDKSLDDGNTFHVIVLTQNKGYRKKPLSPLTLRLAKTPGFRRALRERHLVYNRQLELCERLEREGKAIIIRPREPVNVSRTGRDVKKLLALHDEGHREGAAAVKLIQKRLGIV